MNVGYLNNLKVSNLDNVSNLPVKVSDVKKIEERMCYDGARRC